MNLKALNTHTVGYVGLIGSLVTLFVAVYPQLSAFFSSLGALKAPTPEAWAAAGLALGGLITAVANYYGRPKSVSSN